MIRGVTEAVRPGGEYARLLRAEVESASGRLDALRSERAQQTSVNEQLRARIHDLALRHQIGAPGWDVALKAVGAELQRVDRRIAELQGLIAVGEVDGSNLDRVLAEMARGAELLPQATEDEVRRVLRVYFKAAQVIDGELVLDLYEPDTNDVTPDPKVKGSSVGLNWVP